MLTFIWFDANFQFTHDNTWAEQRKLVISLIFSPLKSLDKCSFIVGIQYDPGRGIVCVSPPTHPLHVSLGRTKHTLNIISISKSASGSSQPWAVKPMLSREHQRQHKHNVELMNHHKGFVCTLCHGYSSCSQSKPVLKLYTLWWEETEKKRENRLMNMRLHSAIVTVDHLMKCLFVPEWEKSDSSHFKMYTCVYGTHNGSSSPYCCITITFCYITIISGVKDGAHCCNVLLIKLHTPGAIPSICCQEDVVTWCGKRGQSRRSWSLSSPEWPANEKK